MCPASSKTSHLLIALFLVLAVPFASANQRQAKKPGVPEALKEVGIVERLGESVSINELQFVNEDGKTVSLSQYFKRGKPVLLNLVYFECPTLCSFVLNGLLDSLKRLSWTPGQEFELLTISIDHRETPKLAATKKAAYLKEYGREGAENGWHFLTGTEDQIRKLAAQVGFGFKYDEQEMQYAHGAVLTALTPEGKISRYLYGIEYSQKNMRLALLEASNGAIGTVIDRVLLFCYRYDPASRKYSVYATRLMNAGAAGTTLIFGGWLAMFWRRQRKLVKEEAQAESGDKDKRQGG